MEPNMNVYELRIERRETEELVPGPYLELFARLRRQGWDAWGKEVDIGIGKRRWASNSYPEADGARS
jgi:hypothetical protein